MAAVTFARVSKRYGATTALDALDLEIGDGEFVSLLGPSGSGKTTTLNLLAGLLDADDGDIRIGGQRVNDVPPDRRDIAMVFQNYALYPHMTVFENVAFPLEARRPKPKADEIATKVERVAAMLGVKDLLHRYPRELSGGQQQRVALGRAMVRDPKVFLLDEPLSNLDARLRIRMRHDIKQLHAAIGSTIVYVTHDQAEAMTLSSRIAVFNHGRLQQYAPPDAIYNRPANMFVANFVGEREVTFLHGRLAREGAHALFAGDALRFRLPGAAAPLAAALDRPAVIGIRAEAVAARGDGGGALPGTVTVTELSGPDQIAYVRVADGVELACRADPAQRLARDMTVTLDFVAPRLLAFDPQTTLSLLHTA